MNNVTFRQYCEETDFECFYDFQLDYSEKVTAYQLSGASPYVPRERFREQMEKLAKNSHFPFVIADDQNRPIGAALIEQYVRVARHRTFHIYLWEQPELMEQVLAQTLETIFTPHLKMAICRVTGNETALLEACRKAGMEQVGCIPDYFCYDGDLYPEYTFIARNDNYSA